MFSYESGGRVPPALWGGGFWHSSCLFLLSLEQEVLNFSDDTLADLTVPSAFSLALPTGLWLPDLLGSVFDFSRLFALLLGKQGIGRDVPVCSVDIATAVEVLIVAQLRLQDI